MQTSYHNDMPVGQPGLKYDIGFDNVLTYRATETIPFGRAVIRKAGTEKDVLLPNVADGDFVGITVHNPIAIPGVNGDAAYLEKSPVGVLTRGRIYVGVEADVTVDDTVYVRYAAGAGGDQLGQFRNDADTATAFALDGARFVTNGTAGGIAVVEINLPR